MGKDSKPAGSEQPPENLDSVESLKTFVKEHQVCWEVLAEQMPALEDRPLQVGFDLRLYGAHVSEAHPIPGCEKCKAIYKGLRKIAKWIIPKENRVSRYEIEIFDSAIRYDQIRNNRPDVILTIKILHRSDFDHPVDECEVQCLNEMKEKLSMLGAHEKQWKSS